MNLYKDYFHLIEKLLWRQHSFATLKIGFFRVKHRMNCLTLGFLANILQVSCFTNSHQATLPSPLLSIHLNCAFIRKRSSSPTGCPSNFSNSCFLMFIYSSSVIPESGIIDTFSNYSNLLHFYVKDQGSDHSSKVWKWQKGSVHQTNKFICCYWAIQILFEYCPNSSYWKPISKVVKLLKKMKMLNDK